MTPPLTFEAPLALVYRTDIERMFVTGSMTSPKPTRARSRRFSIIWHRIFPFLAALAFAFLSGGGLRADGPADAGLFVAGLTDDVIQRVIEPEIDEQERADRLHALLSETLAVETIGRFVLGRYWITATESERAAFLDIFAEVMTDRFMPLLTAYSGERIQVGQIRSDPDRPTIFTVASQLLRPEGAPVNVTWRVQREGQVYRVIDVIAEGVSMAITLRSEYRSFIRQHSGRVAALIAALRDRIGANAATVSPDLQASQR